MATAINIWNRSADDTLFVWVDGTHNTEARWWAIAPGKFGIFRGRGNRFIKLRKRDGDDSSGAHAGLHAQPPSAAQEAQLHLNSDDTYEYVQWEEPFLVSTGSKRRRADRERRIVELQELSEQLQTKLQQAEARIASERAAGTWREQAPAELRRLALQSMTDMDSRRFNLALVGPTGIGKSSLVNALIAAYSRRQASSHSSAGVDSVVRTAQVDASKECTQQSSRYDLPSVRASVWDLPGGGTERHPTHTFVVDKHVAAFDMQLIVIEGRFTDFHSMIFEAARAKFPQQAVAVVSVKGDSLVQQESVNTGADARAAFGRVKASITAEVLAKSRGLIHDVFLLSSWALKSGDDASCWMDEAALVEHLDRVSAAWLKARDMLDARADVAIRMEECGASLSHAADAAAAGDE